MRGPQEVGRHCIALGDEVVDYTLRRSDRKTLGITVEPDATVVVTAPWNAPLEHVESILRRRSGWILRQRRAAASLPAPPPPKEWVSGETHRYLGRQYRLKVVAGMKSEIKLVGRFFHVVVPDPADTDRIRRRMERWYLDHARVVFQRRMVDLIRSTPRLRRRSSSAS